MKKLPITLTFALAMLLCAAAQSMAATVSIGVSEDAYVHSGNPNNNYGSSTLYVGDENWNDPVICCRSYLKFNLGAIPAGATITSAKIYLYIWGIGNPTSMDVSAHYVTDDTWTEGTITWNTAPAFNAAVSATTTVSTSPVKLWSWDVTADAQTAFAGDGILSEVMRDTAEYTQGRWAGFVSKEEAHLLVPTPYLEVDYDDGTQMVLKWSQPPVLNPESQYPDCFWGWDEVSIYGPSSGLWFPAWSCATQCYGDANCDGVVDAVDLAIFMAAMGGVYPNPPYDPRADFDRDGDVDAADQAILMAYYGTQPPRDCATSPSQQKIVADDWLCKTNQPVTDVHWWGSYEGYQDDVPPAGPDSFHIGIWTDVPAGVDQEWSHPDKMIWEWIVPRTELNETYVGCDFHPEYMEEIDSCFRYDFIIPEDQWFYQEDPNTVYWISIAAFYPDGTPEIFPWGWKTRPHFFNDDAVRIFSPTDPVIGSVFELGEPIEDEAGNSWDMAFELTTIEETPPPDREYGDAPEGANALAYPSMGVVGNFPTCKTIGPAGYIEHNNFGAHFGPTFDFEPDGNAGLCPSAACFPPYDQDECFQDGDAGLLMPDSFTIDTALNIVTCTGITPGTSLGQVCTTAVWGTNIDIDVTNFMPSNTTGYVNVLVDWDQGGSWGGSVSGTGCSNVPEHVLVDFPVPNGYSGPLSGLMAAGTGFTIGPKSGYVWVRFSITEVPVAPAGAAWIGDGSFEDGETEDYLLLVDPVPSDEKLKFQQLPLDGAMVRQTAYYGHDEVSTVYPYYGDPGPAPMIERYLGCYMADDFADYEHSPVIRVKWWGSYLGNEWIQTVNSFIIAFESDFAGPPSHPLELLQHEQVIRDMDGVLTAGEFSEVPISGGGAPCYETLYEYEAILANPFPQDPNTVYWLKIVAVVDLPPDHTFFQDPRTNPDEICDFLNYYYDAQYYNVTRWGWHNRDYTRMDPYAATPPAVVPGEHVQGNIPDGTADGVDVWHFQDDSVTGPVQMWVDADDPANPKIVEIEQMSWLEQFYKYFLEQCGEGVDGPDEIEQYSKDLAFELWTPTICVKPTASFYADWVTWGRPDCWCYRRQCRGDANGAKLGPYWVQTTDLNAFVASYFKIDTVLATVNVGGVDGICCDFNHAKLGPYRVQTADLNEFVTYYFKTEPLVPQCSMTDYYFWEN